MSIHSEYERLKTLVSTPEGWEKFETAWNTAMNQERRDGVWLNRADSKGELVVGFAIDYVTKRCILGTTSRDHSLPVTELRQWLREKEGLDIDDAEDRAIKGWAGKILDFQFPCVFMANWRFGLSKTKEEGEKFLAELEAAIVTQGIGLPLTSLFMQRHQH